MELRKIESDAGKAQLEKKAVKMLSDTLARYRNGSIDALYDLGVAYSTGSHGLPCDMIEAHKWFNIAAAKGHEEAAWCRTDIAEEMTAREIATAQRDARQWLSDERRLAA